MFLLVLVGELLALTLSIAASGTASMDWAALGLRSFMIQWIVLLSAALLCPLRPWLARTHSLAAGCTCYTLVLLVSLCCQLLGYWFLHRQLPDGNTLINTMTLAAILAGIALRYLYIQQQLHNQQQAELEARIQALQSRIQPHFLFNSLNSIASLIAVNPDVAESLVEDLSDLFRASLREPGLIALQEEFELCQRYITIEQRRLGERLQVNWQLPAGDRELNQSAIPSLLLQPLIENAVHHGIQPLTAGGTIELSARANNGSVEIIITNPIASERQDTTGNQIALNNIKHRLQAHFGTAAKLYTRIKGNQFQVTLRYPLTPLASHNP